MKIKVVNQRFNKDNFLEDMLFRNGIYDIDGFIYLDKSKEEDSSLYDNMDDGCEMLNSNIHNAIGMVVDCDVDGYTSAAEIYLYIKDVNPDADIKLFFHTGKQHGLNDSEVLNDILKSNVGLIIATDSSSNDYDQHKVLKNAGIGVLILDHHECLSYSEDAIIINNQLSDNVTNKHISGAGVTYKFMKYYDEKYGFNYADKYIDLVALGNIGDMMSILEDDTRYLCVNGIKKDNLTNRFIKALINKYIDGEVNMTTIAWNVVPKINAIIRAGTQDEKVELFNAFINPTKKVMFKKNSRTPEKNVNLSTKMTDLSEIIKKRQDKEVKESVAMFEGNISKDDKCIIIKLDNDVLDKSFTGLVANKLMGSYKRPILLLQRRDDVTYGGSCRCPMLYADIENFKEFLASSGLFKLCEGHSNAFGIEIKESNIDDLKMWTENNIQSIDTDDFYEVETVIDANELTEDLILDVANYSWIWGAEFKEPKFLIKNIKLNSSEIDMVFNKTILRFNYNWIQYNKRFCSKAFRESLFVDAEESREITLDVVGAFITEEYKGNKYPKVNITDVDIRRIK